MRKKNTPPFVTTLHFFWLLVFPKLKLFSISNVSVKSGQKKKGRYNLGTDMLMHKKEITEKIEDNEVNNIHL